MGSILTAQCEYARFCGCERHGARLEELEVRQQKENLLLVVDLDAVVSLTGSSKEAGSMTILQDLDP